MVAYDVRIRSGRTHASRWFIGPAVVLETAWDLDRKAAFNGWATERACLIVERISDGPSDQTEQKVAWNRKASSVLEYECSSKPGMLRVAVEIMIIQRDKRFPTV